MGDFFCGSGGFITEYIHFLNDKYKQKINWIDNIFNLYGCDTDRDIIKSAIVDILLLTDTFSPLLNKAITEEKDFSIKENIKRIGSTFEDVFSEDSDVKVKYNFTNPPYGGSGKGENDKLLLKHATKSIQHIATTGSINLDKPPKGFKPTKSKMNLINGDNKETLSLLHGMSILDKNGFYCGVLKEGVFFDGKFKDLRTNLIENYEVKYVISVPQSDFWNTSTKTSILIFKNSGKQTTEVKFCELKETDDYDIINEVNPETNKPISTFNSSNYKMELVKDGEYLLVSYEDLKEQGYSLNYKNYIKQNIQVNEGFKVVKLGDICNIVRGVNLIKNDFVAGDYPVYGGGTTYFGYHNEFNEMNSIIISTVENNAGYVNYHNGKFFASNNCCTLQLKNNCDFTKIYLYYYLSIEQKLTKIRTGSSQPMINNEMLKNFEIPIPKSLDTVKLYLDYLNPANESLQSLQSLQSQKERAICGLIKMLTSFGKDGVEWDEYELEKCINYLPKTLNIKQKEAIYNGKYKFYTNGEYKNLYVNDCMYTNRYIIFGFVGNLAINIDSNFSVMDREVYVLNSLKSTNDYMYYYLKSIMNKFEELSHSTTISRISKDVIKNMKIRILKPHIIAKYKLEEEFEFMDKLKNDISQTLKNQENITKQMMKLVLSSDKTEKIEEIKKTLEIEESSDDLDELEKLEKELEQDEIKPKRTKAIIKVC